MEKVESYITSDGKLFLDFTEASVHQEYLKHEREIIEFLDSDDCPYKGSAHQNIIKVSLIKWLFWKAEGGMNQ
jgi:hypothetical protein